MEAAARQRLEAADDGENSDASSSASVAAAPSPARKLGLGRRGSEKHARQHNLMAELDSARSQAREQQERLDDATALLQLRGTELTEAREAWAEAEAELKEVVGDREHLRSQLLERGEELAAKGAEVDQLQQQLQQVILSSQRAVGNKPKRP